MLASASSALLFRTYSWATRRQAEPHRSFPLSIRRARAGCDCMEGMGTVEETRAAPGDLLSGFPLSRRHGAADADISWSTVILIGRTPDNWNPAKLAGQVESTSRNASAFAESDYVTGAAGEGLHSQWGGGVFLGLEGSNRSSPPHRPRHPRYFVTQHLGARTNPSGGLRLRQLRRPC